MTINFILMVLNEALIHFSGIILNFALSWHVLNVTQSVEVFATMLAISAFPIILAKPFGGVVADRFSKKKLIISCNLLNALITFRLGMLLLNGSTSVFKIGVAITFISLISTIYNPSVMASLPNILSPEKLLKGNGIIQGVNAFSAIGGPLLAGYFYRYLNISTFVFICTIIYGIAAINSLFIQIPNQKKNKNKEEIQTMFDELKEGFNEILNKEPMLLQFALGLSLIVMIYQAVASVALPYLISYSFNLQEEYFGFAQAGVGIALLLGSLAVGTKIFQRRLKLEFTPMWVNVIGILSIPFIIAVSPFFNLNAFSRYFLFTMLLIGIMFVFSIVNILFMVTIQETIPAQNLGKTIAILSAIISIAVPIGQILISLALNHLIILFAIIPVITFLIPTVMLKNKKF